MRSRLDDVDPRLAVVRALELGVVGVGGRLSAPPASAEEALVRTAEEHDEPAARRLERFQAVPAGSTAWTREPSGFFVCGTITGPWRYDGSPAAREADLVHVRDCAWEPPVPEHLVPAGVVAAFRRGGRNFQRVGSPG